MVVSTRMAHQTNKLQYCYIQNGTIREYLDLLQYGHYCQFSNISRTLGGNKTVDHSDVVGASPVSRCSNHIFILELTPGFIGLGKDNSNTRWESFKFGDLVHLICGMSLPPCDNICLKAESILYFPNNLAHKAAFYPSFLLVDMLSAMKGCITWGPAVFSQYNEVLLKHGQFSPKYHQTLFWSNIFSARYWLVILHSSALRMRYDASLEFIVWFTYPAIFIVMLHIILHCKKNNVIRIFICTHN